MKTIWAPVTIVVGFLIYMFATYRLLKSLCVVSAKETIG